ncbi:MAG: hypothetical protein LC637_08810 [Xanthomonadaceae bacterium]|nr:hypothetical protein [Xanthomonadaceae bacterium]
MTRLEQVEVRCDDPGQTHREIGQGDQHRQPAPPGGQVSHQQIQRQRREPDEHTALDRCFRKGAQIEDASEHQEGVRCQDPQEAQCEVDERDSTAGTGQTRRASRYFLRSRAF